MVNQIVSLIRNIHSNLNKVSTTLDAPVQNFRFLLNKTEALANTDVFQVDRSLKI